MNKKSASMPEKLLWVDLEMTGLDPANDRILEVAAIVTDFNFNELALFESIVHQSKTIIASSNQWSLDAHTKSGLLHKIEHAPREEDVRNEFVAFIKANFKEESATLAGNSIHQDRRFIESDKFI